MNVSHKGNILIVDDEPPIRKVLCRYLEKAGYRCHTAESASVAKEMLAAETFDLILSDIMMPGESGIDLIKFSKKHYPKTGRIMITAVDSQDIADELMAVGIYGYLIKPFTKNSVIITVKNALRHLTLDLHMKACVSEMAEKVVNRTATLDAILDNINIGVILVDTEMKVLEMNKKMREWYPESENLVTKHCYEFMQNNKRETICNDCPIVEIFTSGTIIEIDKQLIIDEEKRDFRIVSSPVFDKNGQVTSAISLYEDMTERLNIEKDLHQAQKLEAVGQLAAGIAHEINTPIQFIGDNISFLKDSFEDTHKLLNGLLEVWGEVKTGNAISSKVQNKIDNNIEEADLEYLTEEVPVTIKQSLDGVRRVNKIVKAMKDFSHPGEEEKTSVDINKIIETTLTVCKNEWKYVAEIERDFSVDLPFVPCFPGDLSQAFLNIIVNAAHAIGDVTHGDKKGMGKISIQTQSLERAVQILITDTGGGIPDKIQSKIFDPFFTTKDRGKGTGQGLAIAHRVVVNKHQGGLSFDSKPGDGTTFIIELPTTLT